MRSVGIGIILVGGLGLIVTFSLLDRQIELNKAFTAAAAPTPKLTEAQQIAARKRFTNTAAAPTPKLTEAQQIAARKRFAKKIDGELLDRHIESRTVTTGADAATLVINDILAGRVRAHALGQNAVLMAEMSALGFKELKYTNGDASWRWKLKK